MNFSFKSNCTGDELDSFGRTQLLKVILNSNKIKTRNYRDSGVRNMEAMVESLIGQGVCVNTPSNDGVTPLLAASRKGFARVAKLLIQNNANVNCVGKWEATPLHLSVQNGYIDVVEILLENGANVNSKQKGGVSPLHLAAVEGHFDILKLLLQHAANINDKQEHGATALYLAAENGHPSLVETLLTHEADINITNDGGEVPFVVTLDGIIYNYGNDHCVDNYIKTVKLFTRHVVKRNAARLYVGEQNFKLLTHDKVKEFSQKCRIEIHKMLCERFDNSNVSFCDILSKNSGAVARYLRNDCIVYEMKSENYKEKFPLYADLIETKFIAGLERKRLLAYCNVIFNSLFYQLPNLPLNCMENILNFLNNREIRDLLAYCS